MPTFRITFETTAFGGEAGASDEVPHGSLAEIFEAVRADLGDRMPSAVVGLASASHSVDDSVYDGGMDEEGDVKSFVTVALLVEVDGEEDANRFAENPGREVLEFLDRVSGAFAEGLEPEDAWEHADGPDQEFPTPAP